MAYYIVELFDDKAGFIEDRNQFRSSGQAKKYAKNVAKRQNRNTRVLYQNEDGLYEVIAAYQAETGKVIH